MSGAKIRLLEGRDLLSPLSRWRPAVGELFPRPTPDEAVTLAEFHRWGFGMPAHDFLRSVLPELGIRLHHLHPEGLLQLTGFISPCEGFLGVAPHLYLFLRIFAVEGRKVRTGDATSLPSAG
ncbi:putative retrotransposon protein [Panicum miliaceum]|uniref:Retrotransposon protein n=1 Tax=Panicum miliaceum TaxID=4540 RepID=A0A3L6SV66_PANMI|nr:putative retrotransposon protein [Panicum miliaceum]